MRVGVQPLDNPLSSAFQQLLDELDPFAPASTPAEPSTPVYWPSPHHPFPTTDNSPTNPSNVPAPHPSWRADQVDTYQQLLEVMDPDEAWAAADGLMEQNVVTVTGEHRDWTWLIAAGVTGTALLWITRKRTRRRR